ncbi:RNA polymerase sigma factor [Pseudobacter ginsenosidimutans]|uniref:RNA polymerase sigma-70 factor (ECF subfamily) n=1 Tax=Pseudobacter ginsenosidimutans TaxID=661488 RepID=A0A4Q7N0N5_9BACT|nr:sigma-70 family RNA polymerase sigma factor [Pseudobacter ginsenosidimutans]QEC43457.1 sigma-70 family RNA polymerase sigma factor [Pseudobacter ginsenosidimutans]RZS74843.1 RNA polymerase sigma-70 factor (ECF subfamily) [Pseudobacter ginsenosidimutans]
MVTVNPYEEKELLNRIAGGDEQAFEIILKQYYPKLRPFIYKYTSSSGDMEEVLQNCFLRVWINRDKLPSIIHFSAWIYKVASREYLLYLRQKMKEKQQISLELAESLADKVVGNPEEMVQFRQVKAALREAVELLPEQRKKIFKMSRDEGMKIAEIAAALSVSTSTVKNALTTALKQIREYLLARGYHIPLILLSIMLA